MYKIPIKRQKALKKAIAKLKLSKEVRKILLDIALEINDAWAESVHSLSQQLAVLEGLYLDKAEDRLWHAKDRTWWRRLHGQELKDREKAELLARKQAGMTLKFDYVSRMELYRATPPPEIQRLINAANVVLSKTKVLKGKPHMLELFEALRMVDAIPMAVYLNPKQFEEAMSDHCSTTKGPSRRGKK